MISTAYVLLNSGPVHQKHDDLLSRTLVAVSPERKRKTQKKNVDIRVPCDRDTWVRWITHWTPEYPASTPATPNTLLSCPFTVPLGVGFSYGISTDNQWQLQRREIEMFLLLGYGYHYWYIGAAMSFCGAYPNIFFDWIFILEYPSLKRENDLEKDMLWPSTDAEPWNYPSIFYETSMF